MKKNYKLQITKKMAHELHELTRISEKKETSKTTTKGGHGLHRDSFKLQTMTALTKSFCGGIESVGQWVSESVGQKVRRVEGEKVRSSKMRLKASKPVSHESSYSLYDLRQYIAFSSDSLQSKKPSVGPKGLIGPPCHGTPGRRR